LDRRRCTSQPPHHAFVDVAGQFVDVAFRDYPYAMAAFTCGVKASAADYVAQKRQLSKRTNVSSSSSSSTEKKRNFAFLVYGAVYQGMGQEYIYNTLYPSWFGTSTTISTVLIKVLFDLLVQTTLLTLPVAYLTKALVYQYSAREAMVRYLDDIFRHGLLIKYFSLWGPVQCITFSIIPEHYRISFIAAVSFVWLILCKLSVCFFSSG
jgi:protein Mpv17